MNIDGRPDTNGLPDLTINGAGGFSMGYSCNCPLHERETLLDYINNWAKISGNHTIRFGATLEMAWNLRLPSDQRRAGVYQFNDAVTADATVPGSGLGLASFMLGDPSTFNRFAQISTNQEDRQNRTFYFLQDTWRVTPKLTLSLGVRWDVWFPDFSLNAGQGGRYDVTNNIVYIPGVGGVSQSGNAETQWHNFPPRIGIAYSPNSKTVIRTGYGRGYTLGTFGWTFNNLAADVYPSIINQSLTSISSFFPVFPLTTAPPAVVFPTIPSNGRLPLGPGIGVAYIPANQKIPYVDMWNFTIEQQIAPQLNVSIGYVGNIGRHLNGGFDLNAVVPGPGANANLRRPLFAPYGLTQGIFDKCNCTSSNYNSFQLQANKRFSTAYSLLANFSWQKTLDYGEFGTDTNQYNVSQDYGPAGFDRKFAFTLAHTVELPFGRGRKFLSSSPRIVNGLIAGWSFRGITSYYSGLPFSPSIGNQSFLNSDMTSRPQLIGDPSVPNQSANLWFNRFAYGIPPLYTFGNAGRNSLRGPNFWELDWQLAKNFKLTERVGLEFRWDVFNVINRQNLALPNAQVDSSAGGLITDIQICSTCGNGMRNMQFGAHITF